MVHTYHIMYACTLCSYSSESLKAFTLHFQFHRNVANYDFPCGVPNCSRKFRTYSTFKTHVFRAHQGFQKSVNIARFKNVEADLSCHVVSCSGKFKDLVQFLSHLREHIHNGVPVGCPFKNCGRNFSVKSTFSSHLSRKHRTWSLSLLSDSICESRSPDHSSDNFQCAEQQGSHVEIDNKFEEDNLCDDCDTDTSLLFVTDQDQFVHSLALFYLKLQSKFLLPSAVIQNIIDEFQQIHILGKARLLSKLKEKLTALDIQENHVSNLLKEISADDLFSACNTGILRSDKTRKSFFKSHFGYVEPVEIYLGQDANATQRYCQYVPIDKSLVTLFKQESVKSQHAETRMLAHKPDVFEDVSDGSVFRSNELFRKQSSALRLILYQDAFEVVNPLGSGKKKHKVLAVYFTLADIPPFNRSNIDHMQLVLLCREADFKHFGHKAVFGNLIKDLKSLEETGVTLPDGNTLKGTLCAIAGDNLGSHAIGGFTENFSTSQYCCRYCLIDRKTFQSNPNSSAPKRTIQNYEDSIDELQRDPDATHFGIKFPSIFNELNYFHTCQPGLPPCLGHDLFEGVLSRDLSLFIKHFVKVNKYFTYVQLNRRIACFKYLGSDANNKPSEVSINGDKLGGHAIQNWCLMRLLPLIIGDRIKDPVNDEVWVLCLKLREIVELACAPKVSSNQIAHLKVLTEDYLDMRHDLFPNQPITPKHHYLSHYPKLILQFGPLIRLWTLRFESKHTYFKQCARKLHNFKNLCHTLAVRHQLFQAYLGSGYLFPPTIQVDKGLEFHRSTYSRDIQIATAGITSSPEDTLIAYDVIFKGTAYKKGMFVAVEHNDRGFLFGRIELILVQNMAAIFFVMERCQSVPLVELGVHALLPEMSEEKDKSCIRAENLLDFYPLPAYKRHSLMVISLHHAITVE